MSNVLISLAIFLVAQSIFLDAFSVFLVIARFTLGRKGEAV